MSLGGVCINSSPSLKWKIQLILWPAEISISVLPGFKQLQQQQMEDNIL